MNLWCRRVLILNATPFGGGENREIALTTDYGVLEGQLQVEGWPSPANRTGHCTSVVEIVRGDLIEELPKLLDLVLGIGIQDDPHLVDELLGALKLHPDAL